ncbi:MAG TPA: GWxTD domain-containing protein [Thermoanaerobaculia bacterium]|jgi:GWxTD domain-containing protein
MKRAVIAAFLLTLCAAVASADLSKYKDWDQSPQGYFMTKAERSQWSAITNDADAERFVNDFIARRGGESFKTEVAKRADAADKYLTVGPLKGSKTLRGKLVILFGPPAGMSVQEWSKKKSGGGSNGLGSEAYTTGATSGGGGSRGGEGDVTATGRSGGTSTAWMMKDYTFQFSGKSVPALGRPDYRVIVEVDASTGKDKVKDVKTEKELSDIFESVAQASIKQQ